APAALYTGYHEIHSPNDLDTVVGEVADRAAEVLAVDARHLRCHHHIPLSVDVHPGTQPGDGGIPGQAHRGEGYHQGGAQLVEKVGLDIQQERVCGAGGAVRVFV